MAEKRDYYQVLGVARDVSTSDLKKAYRKLALELHPDRNPGDATAEERFKEASEAYQVLSDDEKRGIYDRYGHQGLNQQGGFGNVEDIFSSFSDIFGDFFGFGGQRAARNGPARGGDFRLSTTLTLKEAAFGIAKEVVAQVPLPCGACSGTGAEGGAVETCNTCKGRGQVAYGRGMIFTQSACPDCGGAGKRPTKLCSECRGETVIMTTKKYKVSFPAGIDEGQSIRVAGQGQPGLRGGPAGHLYVTVEVEDDPRFQREGIDLVHPKIISFSQAALGAKIKVPTLEAEVDADIPSGTQPGDTLRIKAQGIPRLDGRGRGDLIVVLQVDVPKQLSARAKQLLIELQETFESGKNATE